MLVHKRVKHAQELVVNWNPDWLFVVRFFGSQPTCSIPGKASQHAFLALKTVKRPFRPLLSWGNSLKPKAWFPILKTPRHCYIFCKKSEANVTPEGTGSNIWCLFDGFSRARGPPLKTCVFAASVSDWSMEPVCHVTGISVRRLGSKKWRPKTVR